MEDLITLPKSQKSNKVEDSSLYMVGEPKVLECVPLDRKREAGHDMLMDSGGCGHFVTSAEMLENVTDDSGMQVVMGNGEILETIAKGELEILLDDNEKLVLTDVHVLPGLAKNIISVSALDEEYPILFWKGLCTLFNLETGKSWIVAKKKTVNLYHLCLETAGEQPINGEKVSGVFNAYSVSSHVWHKRFGHAAVRRFKKGIALAEEDMQPMIMEDVFCNACAVHKAKSKPHPQKETPASEVPLELVHADVHVVTEKSLGSHQYLLVLVDDRTRISWTMALERKSEVPHAIIQWYQQTTKVHPRSSKKQKRVLKIRTDQGTEFSNEHLESICASQGIVMEASVPYEHQQNGVAE